MITLPVHQFLSEDQIDYTISTIREYFGEGACCARGE